MKKQKEVARVRGAAQIPLVLPAIQYCSQYIPAGKERRKEGTARKEEREGDGKKGLGEEILEMIIVVVKDYCFFQYKGHIVMSGKGTEDCWFIQTMPVNQIRKNIKLYVSLQSLDTWKESHNFGQLEECTK